MVQDSTRWYKMLRQMVSDERLTRAYKKIRDTTIQYEMVTTGLQECTTWYEVVREGYNRASRGLKRSNWNHKSKYLFMVRFSKFFFCWKALHPTNVMDVYTYMGLAHMGILGHH